MKKIITMFFVFVSVAITTFCSTLMAGAGKIEITPSKDSFPLLDM